MTRFFRLSLAISVMVLTTILAGTVLAQENPTTKNFLDKQSANSSAAGDNAAKPEVLRSNLAGDEADRVLKVDSQLVVVDVSVLDEKRNFVPGLDKGTFHIFEDQVEQQIELFSKESVPVSFGLLIDTSGSMRFKLKTVIEAAKELLKLCRPGDEIFVVDMKDAQHIRFALNYTGNFEEANKVLDRMYSSGGTALLDGISTAAKYAKEHASNRRRALVVMTDGDERDSLLKTDQLLDELREEDVQIYLMGFPEGLTGADGAFMEASPGKARNLLKKIAEESGGQAFFPASLNEIAPLATKIGEELRAQYTIGYYPNNDQHDGRYHRLHVKLADGKSKYAVRTRSGYFAAK